MLLSPGCTEPWLSAVLDPYKEAPLQPAIPWRPTTLARFTTDLPVENDKVYDLPALIDLAQRKNPETRRVWEDARAAAAELGRAEAAYLPTLVLVASGGAVRIPYQIPLPIGPFVTQNVILTPQAQLTWDLIDFGRRSAGVDRQYQRALEANFTFNRKHQEIAFAVARSFFTFNASRANVTAAEATLKSASTSADAVKDRLRQGLATKPDFLLALQDRARAAFELEEARGNVYIKYAALAESMGMPATVSLHIIELSALPFPPRISESVEQLVDQGLAQRPDLFSRLATVRAREAEIRRARAAYFPKVSFSGSGGMLSSRYRDINSGPTLHFDSPFYAALINVEWLLFDGFNRENVVREAVSQRAAAEADLASLELRVVREVWSAYVDYKTSQSKHEYAQALLRASEEAYAAILESYRTAGLATVLDLLAAQRDLERARSTEIGSRADILTAASTLAFAMGK